jgi:galactokinase
MPTDEFQVIAPGRVNIIGDHTDYTGGLCLPMAIHLNTTFTVKRQGTEVSLVSADEREPAIFAIDIDRDDVAKLEPYWARYVAGVVDAISPSIGLTGTVTSTIPRGAGLSSSAALEVGAAIALGFEGSPFELALACQKAEQLATGVPTGILDQLASAAGRAGQAMMLDCHEMSISYVPMPTDVEIVVLHSGQERHLAASGYTQRVVECRAAENVIGPLRLATLAATHDIADPVIARRARHVVSENQRVRDFGTAMAAREFDAAGAIMTDSHRSLRDDYESSHPVVDQLVADLIATPGVLGARITGGGFGGCVVVMTEPGALATGWHVQAAEGARIC